MHEKKCAESGKATQQVDPVDRYRGCRMVESHLKVHFAREDDFTRLEVNLS